MAAEPPIEPNRHLPPSGRLSAYRTRHALRGRPRARFAVDFFAGQIAYSGVAFVGSVLTAHLFGPSGRGQLTAWTLAGAIGGYALAGPIPVGIGRAFLGGERKRLLSTAFAHGLIALAVATLAAAAALALPLERVPLFLILVVAIPCGVVLYDLLVVFQASKSAWGYQLVRIVNAGGLTIGLGLLWLAGGATSLEAAYTSFAVGAVAAAAIGAILIGARYGRARHTILREAAERGRGSYAATLLDVLLLRFDQFVVAAVLGSSSLGIYAVGVNWAEIPTYLGHAIGVSAFEEAATLDRNAALRLFRKAAILVGAFTLLVAAAGFALIEPIFGSRFDGARIVLLLLAPGIVARTLGYAGVQILLAQGRGQKASRITAITFAASLVLWTGGAYALGVNGAAAASTLVYMIQMVAIVREFLISPPRS